MTVRDPLPARRHRLQAHWWERQTWRKGRGSSAAASESCTSPSTGRTSRRCNLTEPWQPRSGSGHLWTGKKSRQSGLVYISKVFNVTASAVVGQKESSLLTDHQRQLFKAIWLCGSMNKKLWDTWITLKSLLFCDLFTLKTAPSLWSCCGLCQHSKQNQIKGFKAPFKCLKIVFFLQTACCLLMVSYGLFIVSIIQHAYKEFQRP